MDILIRGLSWEQGGPNNYTDDDAVKRIKANNRFLVAADESSEPSPPTFYYIGTNELKHVEVLRLTEAHGSLTLREVEDRLEGPDWKREHIPETVRELVARRQLFVDPTTREGGKPTRYISIAQIYNSRK